MVRKKISPWTKNNLGEIKNTWERYIAIFAIIALGVAFFSGLVVTRDAMVSTLDKYISDHDLYDYRLLSTMAFDEEDYQYFSDLEGFEYAEAGISLDFFGELTTSGQVAIIKGHSITSKVNQLQIIEGRLPVENNELVVDSSYFSPDDIGGKIRISPENDQETIDSFNSADYTIVGLVQSPEYISPQMGTTSLGNGSINTFVYLPKDGFNLDYYTEMYLKLDGHNFPYTNKYQNLINDNEDLVQIALDKSADNRFNKIINEANEEVAEAEFEYNDGYNEYLTEKASTLQELEDAHKELLDGQKEIQENEKDLLDGQKKIDKGFKEYEVGLKVYEDSFKEYDASKTDALKTFEDRQQEIDESKAQVKAGISEIEESGVLDTYVYLTESLTGLDMAQAEIDNLKPGLIDEIERIENLEGFQFEGYSGLIIDMHLEVNKDSVISKDLTFNNNDEGTDSNNELDNPGDGLDESDLSEQYAALQVSLLELEQKQRVIDETKPQVVAGINEIEESGVLESYQELELALIQLEAGQVTLDEGFATAQTEFARVEEELRLAKSELDSAYQTLVKSREEIEDGKKALEKGKFELEDGFKEYEDGKAEALKAFTEAEEELVDAKLQIDDAKAEILDLEGPTTYIFDRSHNTGYTSFDNDSAIVAGIARVLPIFFFLVAALVCSTTMSRMVDEQRTQIGTLKALGYSDRKITNKYVFYAGSAAIFGCILGFLLGSKYFPIAIWTAYGMLYDFAPLVYVFDVKLAIISLLVSLLCSAGITYLTCKNELLEVPAELIRPKAPKAGKRVFLERIPFIWNRISFLRKVSIRNIFRFKKRLLMTVMGVAGCTALIIAALGIKDSVGNIANYQFDDIMNYDYEIYFAKDLSEEEMNSFNQEYSHILSENVFITKETFELLDDNYSQTFNLIATDDETIVSLIDFHHNGQSVAFPRDGEVAISHKIASELDLSIGDSLTIKISETENVQGTIGGIFENYIDNYMYMSENTYQILFNKDVEYTNSFALFANSDLDEPAEILINHEDVTTLVSTQNLRNMVDDMMTSLNYVVWLVLGFALALAFVVVYNLNNINITERTREIATLKVLGFYPKETYVYVYRENIVLTAIGIFFGLLLGTWLLSFIMGQIQVDFVSFKTQIFPASYLIAILVTFLLTILVNRILKGKIDNINMAESLNSGE